jgi:peptidoglycan hydrolase CwlO-like protein
LRAATLVRFVRKLPAIWLLALLAVAAAPAWAAELDALRGKVADAREEAASLGAEIRVTQERLVSTETEASAAAERERQLSDLLAHGRERAARLAAQVEQSETELEAERRRLRRARRALAQRLVAIYESGSPSTASVILGSGDFDQLATRTEYLQRIEESDTQLAARVEQVRDRVRHELELVEQLKAKVVAYNERLAAARAEIDAVRDRAEAAAAQLDVLAARRAASLAQLKDRIGEWVSEIEAAEAASRAAAEETVGRWLGGPYSIPTYIVMCESGGNYSALNPSSGAGGAYQILPSTWDLYGGQGAPHEAPKAEQDRIAAEIWADSGGGAWVCS